MHDTVKTLNFVKLHLHPEHLLSQAQRIGGTTGCIRLHDGGGWRGKAGDFRGILLHASALTSGWRRARRCAVLHIMPCRVCEMVHSLDRHLDDLGLPLITSSYLVRKLDPEQIGSTLPIFLMDLNRTVTWDKPASLLLHLKHKHMQETSETTKKGNLRFRTDSPSIASRF